MEKKMEHIEQRQPYNYKKFLSLLDQGQTSEAMRYKAEYIPEYLFKFYSFGSAVSSIRKWEALKDNKLWLSDALSFNDPHEFDVFQASKQMIIDLEPNAGAALQENDYRCAQLRDVISKRAFVAASFCTTCIHPTMWAWYGKHKGFCIMYQIKNKEHIYPVDYVSAKIDDPILHYAYGSADDQKRLGQIFSLKHEDWRYEHEYRLIMNIGLLGDEESGRLKTCEECGLTPVAIFLGLESSHEQSELLQTLRRRLEKEKKLQLNLYQMRKNKNGFGLIPQEIEEIDEAFECAQQ